MKYLPCAVWLSGNVGLPRPVDMTHTHLCLNQGGHMTPWWRLQGNKPISVFCVPHIPTATVPPLPHLYKASVWHWQPVLWMRPELRVKQAGIREVRPLLFFAGSAWTSYPLGKTAFSKSIQDNLFKKTNRLTDSLVIFLLMFCTLFMFSKCYVEHCYMLKTDDCESDAALWC